MIYIDEKLKEEYGINVEYIILNNVTVRRSDKNFLEYRKKVIEEIRRKYDLKTLKDNPIIKAYRKFFWKIGIDPTKIRPSSEALLRRVLQGKEIPLINNVVDTYNLASIITLISMGAYDLDKIRGNIFIRKSTGEEFIGIGSKKIRTENHIVIADEEKIISIYPYRDSEYTKITDETRNIIVILCGVHGINESYLKEARNITEELLRKFVMKPSFSDK